jgi:hypothetical protein
LTLDDPGPLSCPAALAWEVQRRLADYVPRSPCEAIMKEGSQGAPVEIITASRRDPAERLCFRGRCGPAGVRGPDPVGSQAGPQRPRRRGDPDPICTTRSLSICMGRNFPRLWCIDPGGGEEVLIGRGAQSIRMSIVRGTLREGPVRLAYALSGLTALDAPILTLRRLLALQRDGRFSPPLYPALTRGRRWAMLIRTLDALAVDPGQRVIATALYGNSLVVAEWAGRSDFLRSRVRRLIRQALGLAAGGYLQLLGNPRISL